MGRRRRRFKWRGWFRTRNHQHPAGAPRCGAASTGKACGNGVIDISEGENCDDGNTESGDGCNRICQTEANWNCPTPGRSARTLPSAETSILTSDETCDDGNTVSGDGCSSDCKTVEPGWQCRVPGKPCNPACGDGRDYRGRDM